MKLTFCGGARNVSGANYLLDNILIDCGLSQEGSFAEKINFEKFPYEPKKIKAVLITHAHIDHIGRLPQLYKAGFRGKIYSTSPTKDFAEDLLIDSENILAKEAEIKNKPHLYDLEDINRTMAFWETVNYHQKLQIENFEIEFFDAGHILGSAFIVISDKKTKIVFSGDLGNVPAPLVRDTEKIEQADYVLIESAYGNRIHENMAYRKDILEDVIENTIKSGGVLMIPAFAMERTQELLYELDELVKNGRIPRAPIFIDSPLAIKLTATYKKYSQNSDYFDDEAIELFKKGDKIFDFPGLRFTLTKELSKEINDVPAPKIIIAGSGMSQGGRILHHEFRYLSDPRSTILFIGYQSAGSLGRHILDGAKTVKIFNEKIPVRCKIKSIDAYSAHADQPKLLNWLKPMRSSLKKVFVVQGEEDQALPLVSKIRDELAIDAEAPSRGESVVL